MKLGMNLDKHPYLTNAMLYRWLDILCAHATKESLPPYIIIPIKVTKTPILILHYTAEVSGQALPHDDSKPKPGDYTAVELGDLPDDILSPEYDVDSAPMLAYLDEMQPGPDDPDIDSPWVSYKKKPPGFQQTVLQRDKRCFLTGIGLEEADSDGLVLGATWIYPPNIAFELHLDPWTAKFDPKKYTGVDNGIVLRRDLVHAFESNSISVDVDDNYRIIIFDELALGESAAAILPKLQTHARPPSGFRSSFSEHLLRQHFKRSLHVHFGGGDIRAQYDDVQILTLLDELGVGHGNQPGEMLPFNNRKWHDTELGRVIFGSHLELETSNRRWKHEKYLRDQQEMQVE